MSKKIYVPEEIPEQYSYIGNITNSYFDLYDKSNIQGSSGVYYRVYYSFEPDYWQAYEYQNSSYYSTNYQQIERTDSILARPDNYKIATTGFCIIFLLIFLINVVTSLIKKGGILGGLL